MVERNIPEYISRTRAGVEGYPAYVGHFEFRTFWALVVYPHGTILPPGTERQRSTSQLFRMSLRRLSGGGTGTGEPEYAPVDWKLFYEGSASWTTSANIVAHVHQRFLTNEAGQGYECQTRNGDEYKDLNLNYTHARMPTGHAVVDPYHPDVRPQLPTQPSKMTYSYMEPEVNDVEMAD